MSIKVTVENFEKEVQELASTFICSDLSYNLSFNAEDKFNSFLGLLKKYGMDYTTRSSARKRCTEKGRLRWKTPDISYFKTPFSVSNIIRKECVIGPKYYKTQKEKSCMNNHSQGTKTRFRLPTKKVGCPATMKIIELKCYPQYTITASKNIREIQGKMLVDLKKKLQNNEQVVVKNCFHITISKLSSHSHSSRTCFLNQELDGMLKKEIEKCVSEGPVFETEFVVDVNESDVRTASIEEVSSLDSVIPAVNDDPIPNGGTSSMEDILPSGMLTSKNSTSETLSNICKIRQEAKDLYDSVFLISPESLDDSSSSTLLETLVATRKRVNNFIVTESNSSIVVLPKSHSLSDLPLRKSE